MNRFSVLAIAGALFFTGCQYIEDADSILSDTLQDQDTDTLITTSADTIQGDSLFSETFIVGTPQAAGDSLTDSTALPTWCRENFGESGWMQVGYYDNSSWMRGLVKVDLPAERCAEAQQATLELTSRWWMKKHRTGPVTLRLYPVTTPWNEGKSGSHSSHSVRTGVVNSADVNGATGLEASHGTSWESFFAGIGRGKDARDTVIAEDTHSPEEGET
ncbi:MAG: hypothetical protein ACQEQV_10735, partial [Fibrobacterota bacterium]